MKKGKAQNVGNICPSCNAPGDGATNLDSENVEPEAGDFSICAYCATVLEFDENLKSQVYPLEKLLELPDETRMDIMRHHRVVTRIIEGKEHD
jgi:hypothetical protein